VLVSPRFMWVIMRLVIWIFVMCLTPLVHAASDEPGRSIAVVYPDIGEPYRGVFNALIEGVEERIKGRVGTFAVNANTSSTELASELKRRDIKTVVALGRQGLKAVSSLDRSINLTAAGVLSVSESEAQNFPIHSLAPDPALLFARLKSLMPAVRRITVVYDPRQNSWLIRLAREAAKAYGIELLAREATDLKSALHLYQEALSSADPKQDVLWLPQDSTTVDDNAVLPLVLQEAWEQSLVVFSSSVTHVKRGALFALYPDNLELGRTLGAWAATASTPAASAAASTRGVIPLRQVLLAVNTRTAAHLGISLSNSPPRISMVFPEP
jgi:putative ABC transport system substrate-binding protein